MAERDGDRLSHRLAAIRARHPGSEPEMVADVVHAVLATMSGDLSAQETSLLAEVEELGHTIACAKAEIAALRFDDITDKLVRSDKPTGPWLYRQPHWGYEPWLEHRDRVALAPPSKSRLMPFR